MSNVQITISGDLEKIENAMNTNKIPHTLWAIAKLYKDFGEDRSSGYTLVTDNYILDITIQEGE